MSKEKKRLDRELPSRIEHFKRCAKHASLRFLRRDGRFKHATCKHTRWLKFITQNNPEDSWASMLHLYIVNDIAPAMAKAEAALKRKRGRPARHLDFEIFGELDTDEARGKKINLVQAVMKVKPDDTRTPAAARRKAAAIRQRQYRERVTKKH